MIITKIEIKNFGRHANTVLDLSDPITAIIGHNGAGKSFLLETIPAVFQGSFPTQGNFADAMTQGFLGDAYLSVEFLYDGLSYKAERKCRKTSHKSTGFSQEAMLYGSAEGFDVLAIAGPKVKEFNEKILTMFGDSKIFFASVFAAQNNAGDIVEASPTERKKILGELLDLSRFQDKADHHRDLASAIKVKLQSYEQSKAVLEDSIEEIQDGYKEELLAHIEELEDSKKANLDKTKEIERRRDELSDELAKTKDLVNQLLVIEEKGLAKKNEIDEINGKLEAAKSCINRLHELEKAQKETEYLKKTNEAAMKKNAEIQKVINANKDLRLQHADDMRTVENMRNNIGKEISSLANKGDTIFAKIESIKKESENRKESLKETVSLLDSGDFNYPQCKSCKFTEHAFKAKEELEAFIDPNTINEEVELLEIQNKIESLDASFNKIQDVPDPEYAPEEELIELGSELEDHTEVIEKLKAGIKDIPVYEDNLVRLEKERQELIEQYKAIKITDNTEITLEVEKLTNEIIVLNVSLEDINAAILDQQRKVASVEEKERKNVEIKARIRKMAEENRDNIKQNRIHEFLQQAFGKSGVQALLIDNTIPNLQVISRQLLAIATHNKLQVQFSTEKHLKSGGTSESLEILCTDDKGTRDITQGFSGGEQKILRAVIRLTLAIYQTMRSKIKLQTLMVDEALDQLSPDNAEAVIRMYGSLTEHFEKVLFISHSDELLVDFPNKIELKKINGRTVIL